MTKENKLKIGLALHKIAMASSNMTLERICEPLKTIEDIVAKEPEREWTPTSEELPELEKYVLCQCRAGIVEVLRLTEYGWLDDEECHYMQGFVIAWMPLPEPYEEGAVG